MNSLFACEEWEGKLYSIDSMKQFYRDPSLPVGHQALSKYKMRDDRWSMISGKDPAQAMPEINVKFDFCIIDTYHHHPVEVLNYISVLPWLNEGAVVVMHDTTVFEWRTKATFLRMFSPRLLLSAVCVNKLIPELPSGDMTASNIAAWQITSDSITYCQNLFDVLYMPWEVNVDQKTVDAIRGIVNKWYPQKYLKMFDEAIEINRKMLTDKLLTDIGVKIDLESKESLIFYGAGFQMNKFLQSIRSLNFDFKYEIWDRNFKRIQSVMGYPVIAPNNEPVVAGERTMIVMIEDMNVFDEIKGIYHPLGYRVIHGVGR